MLGAIANKTADQAQQEQENPNWKNLERILEEAMASVDLEALSQNQWDLWERSVCDTIECLMPLNKKAKEYTVNMVGHSHIDMNWLWPWKETVDVCRRDFLSVDNLMERFPDFYFSQSQAVAYKAMPR